MAHVRIRIFRIILMYFQDNLDGFPKQICFVVVVVGAGDHKTNKSLYQSLVFFFPLTKLSLPKKLELSGKIDDFFSL